MLGQALALLLVMPEVAPVKEESWAGGKGEGGREAEREFHAV